jgi:hypothetical protein
MRDLRRNDRLQLREDHMPAHIEEAHDWSAQLRLWEQAKLRRDLVFTELT